MIKVTLLIIVLTILSNLMSVTYSEPRRPSRHKPPQYSKSPYSKPSQNSKSPYSKPSQNSKSKIVYKKRQHSDESTQENYPFVAAVSESDRWITSNYESTDLGIVLNEKYVLTSAFVATSMYNYKDSKMQSNPLKVFVLEDGKISGKIYQVEKIITHPKATVRNRGPDFLNVALVKVKGCIKNVKSPVLLENWDKEKLKSGTTITVVGLSKAGGGDITVQTSDVPLASRRRCNHPPRAFEFCVNGVIPFNGDFYGGPTMYFDETDQISKVMGITSQVKIGVANYFVKMSEIAPWIKSVINKDMNDCKKPEEPDESVETTPEPEVEEEPEEPLEL